MYLAHWDLAEAPFRGGLDSRSFYRSPTHDEALARLEFLVAHRRRLGLLLGGPGSGKSMVLEVFAEKMRGLGLPVAKFSLLGLDKDEFLPLLASALKVPPRREASGPALWRAVLDRLAEYRYQQVQNVLLLDDAERADSGVVTHLTRLIKQDCTPDTRLTVVLAGTPDEMGCLGRGLLELAELRIDLEPWDAQEMEGFLRDRLAGSRRASSVFADGALTRLHQLSGGIPRRVVQLADLALLAGAGRGLDHVDAETVESACHELGMIELPC